MKVSYYVNKTVSNVGHFQREPLKVLTKKTNELATSKFCAEYVLNHSSGSRPVIWPKYVSKFQFYSAHQPRSKNFVDLTSQKQVYFEYGKYISTTLMPNGIKWN